MRCPKLIKEKTDLCSQNSNYRPSRFELREYCKTRLHKICPFFLGYHHSAKLKETENALSVL
jgi:hypothetical protein